MGAGWEFGVRKIQPVLVVVGNVSVWLCVGIAWMAGGQTGATFVCVRVDDSVSRLMLLALFAMFSFYCDGVSGLCFPSANDGVL